MEYSQKWKVNSGRINKRSTFYFLRSTFYVLLFTFYFLFFALATTFGANMDATDHWAWNDLTSWIDLAGVTVADATIIGTADSGIGKFYLNSGSYPGALPPGVSWSVSNDGVGNLSGFAWNDAIGWISFWCGNGGASCAASNYRVTIDGSDGNFTGYGWNDIVGWISFWCGNGGGSCSVPAISYRARTAWRVSPPVTGTLDSSVFDAGSTTILNSVLWQGNLNGGTVRFQIASSNAVTGPWSFVGPNNNPAVLYSDLPGKTIPLTSEHAGKRYARYRVSLTSAAGKSPRIHDVIINWSR